MATASPGASGRAFAELRLAMSAGQAVADNTLVTLSFDTLVGNNNWGTVNLPATTFTAPFTGKYYIEPQDLDWGTPNNIAGYRSIGVSINGGVAYRLAAHPANPTTTANTSNTVTPGTKTIWLTAGDTIALKVRQDSGSSLSPAVLQLTIACVALGAFP